MLLQPGISASRGGRRSVSWRPASNIEVDEITESYQREPAPEDFDIAIGRVAKGTLAALQFEIGGMVKGHPAIVIEHVTAACGPTSGPTCRSPPRGDGSYRVEIIGEPS